MAEQPIACPSTWGPPSSQLRVRAVQLREADRYREVLRRDSEPSVGRLHELAALLDAEDPERPAFEAADESARVGCDGCGRCAHRKRVTARARGRVGRS
jgi:hypothetical protein